MYFTVVYKERRYGIFLINFYVFHIKMTIAYIRSTEPCYKNVGKWLIYYYYNYYFIKQRLCTIVAKSTLH